MSRRQGLKPDQGEGVLHALIFVPPLTDFSNDPDIAGGRWRDMDEELGSVRMKIMQWSANERSDSCSIRANCIKRAPAVGSS